MELIDYIDYDEGRDFPRDEEQLPVCDGCLKEAALLTYQPEWDIFACPACIAECEKQLREEDCTCVRIDVDYYDARGCAAHGMAA